MRRNRRQAGSAWEISRAEFRDWHSRAFMLWMAFMTVQPPERPGTGVLAYSLIFGRQRHSWTMPRGGSIALPRALARLITDHGGTVLTGKRVTRLLVEGGRCAGVETEQGDVFRAGKAVLSSIHVKHLVEMAPPQTWDGAFTAAVEAWQPGTSMFVTHYAVAEPPRFRTPLESRLHAR